jgi:pyrimidine-nucleoside phosphorylase
MLSGRGLGHTGGTLDKLESVTGLKTNLSADAFVSQVNSVGCCIASQSDEMTPADGKIYALRDVTGTVESLPLIVSSIVSKKVAEGAGSLVFDVKWGRGAFMRRMEDALELASELVKETERFERRAIAFVTDMNQPLGRAVGNAMELVEATDILRGAGPADVTSITLLLGGAMLHLAGMAESIEEGTGVLRQSIRSGAALNRLKDLVRVQGGDPTAIDDTSLLPVSRTAIDVTSDREGYVSSIDARGLGSLVCSMGGGRSRSGDAIDHGVGALLLKKEGDPVKSGEALARLHTSDRSWVNGIADSAAALYDISFARPEPRPLVTHIVTSEGYSSWGQDRMPTL